MAVFSSLVRIGRGVEDHLKALGALFSKTATVQSTIWAERRRRSTRGNPTGSFLIAVEAETPGARGTDRVLGPAIVAIVAAAKVHLN